MKKYLVLALFAIAPVVYAADYPNGKDELTCSFQVKETGEVLDFPLFYPAIYNEKLWVCTYNGGPSTNWTSIDDHCKDAPGSAMCR